MDLSFRFDPWWLRLPQSPTEDGVVQALVIRPRGGAPQERTRPEALRIDPEGGIAGDRWVDDPEGSADTQVSLINSHVVASLARDSEHASLSGDNLHVDLCLSEANLPVGTRLAVGDSAVLEVGAIPHRPCGRFVERFGKTAAKKVARASRLGNRGRGVLCRVVVAGEIRVGDRIRVARPS